MAPNTHRVNTITTLPLIMRQQPIIIGKLLIIMRAAGTIEERNIHPRPMNTAVKRMGTPPPHIRIPANKNSWRPNSLLGSPLPSAAGFLFRRLASKMVPRSRIGVMRANGA
jgi:hypothetical protein